MQRSSGRNRDLYIQFTPQIAAAVRAGPGQSQKPRTLSRSLVLVKGPKPAFPCTLEGSWI